MKRKGKKPKKQTLEDLLKLLDSFNPLDPGVGGAAAVCKLQSVTGDKSAAAESLSDGEEDESPLFSLPGTYTHRFIPRATFTFLHLLPIPAKLHQDSAIITSLKWVFLTK